MKTRDMVLAAMFTAVVAALGLIPPIPSPFSPVPITAQTFGVMLAGAVLGPRLGGLSLLLFDLLVAMGVPVLSGGRGGMSVLLGPSGGYIMSYPIAAFLIGYLADRYRNNLNVWKLLLFNILGGMIFVYLCGVTYLSVVTGTPWLAAMTAALIYLPGDLTKAIVSAIVAIELRKRLSFKRFADEG
ncbi:MULTISPECIES: biotin transporter BioY [Bacillus]|uniref:biotin transporter BioY n=1 Tax=Bacillus TaxID=1386 RepID=UPI00065E1E97|nr:biotin transporter BioY [Bacillus smithii]AKP45738.1 Substrate-specific component BioY of biotin ECF transporter [Bacillus smithii]MED0661244.1 biotin transporter BioY [Bacillus smithii]MED1419493.1 biotin transporter BioY [Bacillus smithii]MED1457597.1 biotin transporter BioY [Bacillus smithii]MED4884388.1 biotin transporter BioY [Bacillus smithii]